MFLQTLDVMAQSEPLQFPKDWMVRHDGSTSVDHWQQSPTDREDIKLERRTHIYDIYNTQAITVNGLQNIRAGTSLQYVYRRRPVPIESLPVDILSEVFKHCILKSQVAVMVRRSLHDWKEYFTNMPPRNLLRVCRTWRAMVLDTSALWAYLHVVMLEPSRMAWKLFDDLLDQYLRLSGSVPLHYVIQLKAGSQAALEPSISTIEQLLLHQSRWARIEIDGIDGHVRENVPSKALALNPASLLKLKEFRTDTARHFDLDAIISPRSRIQLQNLKILDLNAISPSTCTGLMVSATNLESFSALLDSRVANPQPDYISLPTSHSIRNLHIRGDMRAVGQVIDALKAPNLKSLSLLLYHTTGGPFSFEFLLAFIECSLPPLTLLRLENFSPWVARTNGQLLKCLWYLPTLTRLELDQISFLDPVLESTFMEELSSSPSSSKPRTQAQSSGLAELGLCLHLQILKLSGICVSKEAWVRFFRVRWDPNIPHERRLRRIELSDCSIPEGFYISFFESLGDVASPGGDSVRQSLQASGVHNVYWCSKRAYDEDPEAHQFFFDPH